MNDSHDLLGAYCTDALDRQQRAAFEEHLVACPACRAEVAEFREVLGVLAEASPVLPPAALEEAVLARALSGNAGRPDAGSASATAVRPTDLPGSPAEPGTAGGTGPGGGGRATERGGTRWARAGAVLAVAAAGATIFAAGIGVGRSQVPVEPDATASVRMADVVAVASAADAHVMDVDIMGTTSRLVASDEMDKSVFLAAELPTPAKGMCYQVWRVTDDGRMVSAGVFVPGPDGHVATVLEGGTADAQRFMITIEPPGGSDHPTGEMLGEVDA